MPEPKKFPRRVFLKAAGALSLAGPVVLPKAAASPVFIATGVDFGRDEHGIYADLTRECVLDRPLPWKTIQSMIGQVNLHDFRGHRLGTLLLVGAGVHQDPGFPEWVVAYRFRLRSEGWNLKTNASPWAAIDFNRLPWGPTPAEAFESRSRTA